jgi:hypothetical protein
VNIGPPSPINPASGQPFPGGDPVAASAQPPRRGWLQADPDELERFADELGKLVELLERVRSKQSDMALFASPSVDPATVAAAARLAEDGHDRPGTPVHVVAATIGDLRQQVRAARMAARDYRAAEQAIIENVDASGENLT